MAGITITGARSTAVDFSIPYHMEPAAVAIKVVANKWLYFVKPLSLNLYCLYFFLPVFLAGFIWMTELFSGFWVKEKTNLIITDMKLKLNRLFHLYVDLGRLLITDCKCF